MKKIFLFILLFGFAKVNAQISDVKGIVSGNFISIKKQHVKTITLKKNRLVVNKIELLTNENGLVILGKDTTTYYFNDRGYPITIKSSGNTYKLKYFENNALESISQIRCSDRNIRIESTETTIYQGSKSISNKLKMVNLKDGKVSENERFFFNNKQDSLLSFNEEKTEGLLIRKYLNGAVVTIRRDNNFTSIDSIYSENNLKRYYKESRGKKDSIIVVSDSVWTKVYDSGIIKYERSEFKGKIMTEKFYSNDGLAKSKKYYYQSYYDDVSGLLPIGEILWKTETVFNRKKKETLFPNKEYFRMKKGKLVIKNKKSIGTVKGCGVAINEKRIMYSYIYEIFSSSILNIPVIKEPLIRAIYFDTGNNLINYCSYNVIKQNCNLYLGDKFKLAKDRIRYFINKVKSDRCIVEIVLENGKVYNFSTDLQMIDLNFDIFSVLDQ
ncbi:MAG TPA: hypothetical protein VF677_06170 [Flavobacterium sp.]|jgi:hypothetical protein